MSKASTFSRLLTAASAVIVIVTLAFCVPQYIKSHNLSAESPSKPAAEIKEDAVEAFIAERKSVRELEVLQLNAVAADDGADSAVRAQALSRLIRLTDNMEKETTLEGILRMRGFEDAVVTVHTDSVNVVVRADELTQSESAIILELVMRETGQTGGNVKIMTVGGK